MGIEREREGERRHSSGSSLRARWSARIWGLFVRFEPPCTFDVLGSGLELGGIVVLSLGGSEAG